MSDFFSLFLDFSSFLQIYQRIRRFKDFNLSETTLIKKRRSNETFILKEESLLKESQFQAILNILKRLFPLNKSRFFSKLIQFSSIKDSKSGLWSLYLIYEYNEFSLEKEIITRMKINQRFEDAFLMKLMAQLIEAAIFLKNLDLNCFEMAPNSIFLEKAVKNKGFDSIKIKYFYRNQEEKLAKIPDYSLKSEVFNIGALAIQLMNSNSLKIYQKTNEFMINFEKIEQNLETFNLLYSKKLISLIKSMMEFDLAKRPDLLEIRAIFLQKIKPKSNENPLNSMISSTNSLFSLRLSTKISKNSNKPEKTPKTHHLLTKSISLMQNSPFKSLRKNGSDLTKSTNKIKTFTRNNSSNSNKSSELAGETPSRKTRDSQKFVINSTVNLKLFDEEKKGNSLNNTPKKRLQETPKSMRNEKKKSPIIEKKTRNLSSEKKKLPISRKKGPILKNSEIQEKSSQNLRKYAEKLILSFEKRLLLTDSVIKKIYEDGSIFHGQFSKNPQQRSGLGIYYYPHNEIYAGSWLQDKFHGQGAYIYDNFEVFEGELKSGFKEGFGIYRYLDGSIYEGEWKFNRKHGHGIMRYCFNDECYEGNWENGEKEGAGIYCFKNGNIFEGFWRKGQKNGKGKVFFEDGGVFEGEWKMNSPNGLGKMIYANGDIYEGNFICGIKEGDGIYIHKVGDKYEGKIRNDGSCQEGIYCYSNKDKYIGKIKDSKREEFGEYIYANGAKYKGEWKNNLKHGMGILHLGENSYYEGNWREGKRNGFGIMIYKNGEMFEGFWKNDLKEIKGKYVWPNGSLYEGEWKDDKMDGKGIYTNENGEKFIGMWNENLFVKNGKI